MDFESKGNGCCSCLMAAEGMNLAPETLRLVCTEATIIHPSVDVDGVSDGRAVVVEVLELFRWPARSVVDSVDVSFSSWGSTLGVATVGKNFFFPEPCPGIVATVAPSDVSLISSVIGDSVLSMEALSTKPKSKKYLGKCTCEQSINWKNISKKMLSKIALRANHRSIYNNSLTIEWARVHQVAHNE